MIALPEPEKGRADDRLVEILSWVQPLVGKQIPGNMFGHKLIVGHISIESANNVVTISPGILDGVIEFVPQGLGIANEIQPMAGPTLPKMRRREQAIHNFGVSSVGVIAEKGL